MNEILDWTGPVEGYVVNFIKRHGWKTAGTQERDDLLQEARMVHLKVTTRYPDVTEPAHMMALFKTAWTNRYNDLAILDTRDRVLTPLLVRGEDGAVEAMDPQGDADCGGYLAVMVSQAPAEVKSVLSLFLTAPAEILELALEGWTGTDKRLRLKGSERVNKLLGIAPGTDSLGAVQEYFRAG